ncbi:alpha/beta fold hydrolase [Gymnodinialimonas hymeniacidonis]|uniref:alpha/beta fold hydrolase n=1 Tax=Gymnodinialimonas hymeniacidonis TaxID=3126508 RepID=UPI0034C600B4
MTWTTRPRSDLSGLACIRAGDGPQVVLLHGVGLRSEAWNAQIDALSATHSVIAIDMPGHGETPFTDFTIETQAAQILRAIDGPFTAIGHSMGAMIAVELARQAPTRIKAVAALNAIFERTPEAHQAVQSRAASLDGPSNPAPTLDRWFGYTPSPERTACETWLRDVDPAAYKHAYTLFAASNGPSRNTLRTLFCPALFLTGGDEPNSTPKMSHTMAALAPKGRAEIIRNAAHMMPMTHATYTTNALKPLLERT